MNSKLLSRLLRLSGGQMVKTPLKLLCLAFVLVGILDQSTFAGGNGPKRLLKGIKMISYQVDIEKGVGDGCKIDEDRLNTSLQFIANQSTSLKIKSGRERFERSRVLSQRLNDVSNSVSAKMAAESFDDALSHFGDRKKQIDAAAAPADENNNMPSLMFGYFPLQAGSGCAATVSASLTASIEPTRIRATKADVNYETIEIWSETYGIVGPPSSFSDYAIGQAGQMMKKFINDWNASQEM